MSYILVDGCNTDKQIGQISITAQVTFSRLAWVNKAICEQRLKDLKEELEQLLEKYYDISEISGDIYSNREYREKMGY